MSLTGRYFDPPTTVPFMIYCFSLGYRLPRSYVKWIGTLAGVDNSIIRILQCIRAGTWSYRTGSPQYGHILQKRAQMLGRPAEWGDPSILPAYGGTVANSVWKFIGVHSRSGVGGVPCEVVHGITGASLGLQHSCATNTGLRVLKAFLEALAIYLPVRNCQVIHQTNISNFFILTIRCISYLYSSLVHRSFSGLTVSSKHSWVSFAARPSFPLSLVYTGIQSALHGLSYSLSSFLSSHMISGMVHLVAF